jgi:hypothetical protein
MLFACSYLQYYIKLFFSKDVSRNFILVGSSLLCYLYMLYKHTTQKPYICDTQTQLNKFYMNFICILRKNFICSLCNPNVKSCVFKNFFSIVYIQIKKQ